MDWFKNILFSINICFQRCNFATFVIATFQLNVGPCGHAGLNARELATKDSVNEQESVKAWELIVQEKDQIQRVVMNSLAPKKLKRNITTTTTTIDTIRKMQEVTEKTS